MPLNDVIGGFPVSLFLTLSGVTLLFAQAQQNRTLDRIAHRAVRVCRRNAGLIPIMFLVLGSWRLLLFRGRDRSPSVSRLWRPNVDSPSSVRRRRVVWLTSGFREGRWDRRRFCQPTSRLLSQSKLSRSP
jgi:Dicarboxylate carrier protein MatC N-terminus